MYDLANFGLKEMIESGRQLRLAARNAASMQEGASSIVDLLYDCFRSPLTGEPSFALIRCFKTHPFGTLPPFLQRIARATLPEPDPPSTMSCLVLLASRGIRPAWNSPRTSTAHQVIPLPTAETVEKAPMLARVILQMGLTLTDVVHPGPGIPLDLERQSFNVFHVEDAAGSDFVPDQQNFILPCDVRSILGFGGSLPSSEIFAVVMFTTVTVPRETAELFRTLALSVKLALLPFAGRRIFAEESQD